MIPKIIHYCWLNCDQFPEDIQGFMETWQKILPDYEFKLWDFNCFDKNSSVWVKQAFENKKYAFAADYIRLFALYNYGGIYLDTDVEVLKSFDDLLQLPYFIGKEDSEYEIESATFGSEKGCYWIGKCLEHYDNRKFEIGFGKFDTAVLPSILKKRISKNYKLLPINSISEFNKDQHNVCILPIDYFSPKKYDTKELLLTNNTYSIHHFKGSWSANITVKEKIRCKLSDISIKIGFYKLFRLVFKKKNHDK